MHTTKLNGATFHHNGDFSGHVDVVETGPKGESVNLANVPMAAIEQFVAEKYRDKLQLMIEALDLSTVQGRNILLQAFFAARSVLREK